MYDVIPAGEFQPSSVMAVDQANDFDIWRNIVRELSEEFLGAPEHGSRSTPTNPLAALRSLRVNSGRLGW